MAFASGSSSSFSAEINVTPLIDVLLVLLIIFMVIIPVVPRGLGSALPHPGKQSLAAQPTVLSMSTELGNVSYAINTRPVLSSELRSTLTSIFAARQDRTLFVQADKSLTYGEVAYAIGQGKVAGAQTVAFMPAMVP